MVGMVEAASAGILALCAAAQARAGAAAARRFAAEALLLGAAGWLAEDACIRLFGFYAYADGWTARLDRVPLMVACIWPFVILSAREVARLWGGGPWLPVRTGLLVAFDAALIEPVAVRAGLWSWSEPGVLGVPLIGLAGWGTFAGVAVWLLDAPGRAPARRRLLRALLPPLAALLANGALVALWWSLFRWGPRQALPPAACAALSAFAAGLVVWGARGLRGALPLDLAVTRAAAASLFVLLLALRGDGPLWAYAAPFSVPWAWLCARPGLLPARSP